SRAGQDAMLGEQPHTGSRQHKRSAGTFREASLEHELALDETLCEPRASHLARCVLRPHERAELGGAKPTEAVHPLEREEVVLTTLSM
ncbi:hypothetical protein KTE11_28620, partial [Burkholderia multivorans]|uniref:hypothetical protein n=1 Tax=Burkholderia multivorans TaxID=87883 RepID=UPI001C263F36